MRGEPAVAATTAGPTSVYPRVCGGAVYVHNYLYDRQGLSPRVRGNLDFAGDRLNVARSIPACAGEPP